MLLIYLLEEQTVIENQQNEITTLQNIVFSQETDLIDLRQMVTDLQIWVSACCESSKGAIQIPNSSDNPEEHFQLPQMPLLSQEKAILYQNTPNPFSSNTEITCKLPETTKTAVVYIYNMQGAELKAFHLAKTGLNSITVYGSELSAGMYLYTLVADNEIIDTKRMILTK